MERKDIVVLGSVKDFFHVNSKLFTTNNSQAFKAIQKDTGRSVILWVLKKKFDIASDEVDISQFLSRLEKIKSFTSAFSDIINFSIDKDGIGYCTTQISSYMPILQGKLSYGESMRRFLAILDVFVKLHSENIVFGDICGESFGINREGHIKPIALLGAYPSKHAFSLTIKDFVLPQDTETISFQSDVYRLGMIMYKLFSCDKDAYPFDDSGNYIPISVRIPSFEKYLDMIIHKCLKTLPDDRYENAIKLKEDLVNQKEKNEELKQNIDVLNPNQEEINAASNQRALMLRKGREKEAIKKKVIMIFLGVVLVLIVFILFSSNNNTENHQTIKTKPMSQEEKNKKLELLEQELNVKFDSEDPLIYQTIVKMAFQAQTTEERRLVEKYIAKRFKNSKYEYTAQVLEGFFKTNTGIIVPSYYENFLLSMDLNFPIEKRISLFKKLSKENKKLIVNASIALAIDSKDLNAYKEIFKLFLDEEFLGDYSRRDFYTLAMSEPMSWQYFEEELLQKMNEISDENLVWLLPIFVKNDDKHLNTLIELIKNNGLLSELQANFLSLLNEIHPTKAVKDVILKSCVGKIQREDVRVILAWQSPSKEKVLNKLLLLLEGDAALQKEILDTMSTMAIKNEDVKKFIKYVMDEEWENRHNFAGLIPYLNSPENFSKEKIISLLKNSMIKLSDERKDGYINMLLEFDNLKIKKMVFEEFYNSMQTGTLINYLSSKDTEIKKLAIEGLRKMDFNNDVVVSNLIIEKYENEEDDEIREIYRTSFWFIRQRE